VVVATASTVKSQVIDLPTVRRRGNLEVEEHVSGVVTKVTSHVIVQPRPMDMEVVVVVEEDATGAARTDTNRGIVRTRPEGAAEVVLGVVRRGI